MALMEPEVESSLRSVKRESVAAKTPPRLDVRVDNLSISASVSVTSVADDAEVSSHTQLPTLVNDLRQWLTGLTTNKTVATKNILRNVSGVFLPGTMTLVLGQPGSGKSSLLKTLGGRFPMTGNVHVEGAVTYSGTNREEMGKFLPRVVSYVSQHDTNFPMLTAKETLQFAQECCGGDKCAAAKSGSVVEDSRVLEQTYARSPNGPEHVIRQLGLVDCQDTIVGDTMTRGLSGGERKRVTMGEMQFGDKLLMLMDEISTGLDSATALDIVTAQRSLAKNFHKTVVMALLQPSPEIFGLFDNVILLNDGHVMYNGPCSQVEKYFGDLGFVRPPGRDLADFLVDLGTEQQQQYCIGMAREGRGAPLSRASDFADQFARSTVYDSLLERLATPHQHSELLAHQLSLNGLTEFHQSAFASTMTLLRRQLKINGRNRGYIFGRLATVSIVGALYSTIFYQVEITNVAVVIGALFMSMVFLALGQATENPTFMAAREVFYKQRGANFFRTESYVFAHAVCQLPLMIVESLIFGSILYWVCGFVPTATNFIIYELIVLLSNLAFAAWFFFVAAIAPNILIAEPLGLVSLLCYVLFAGYVITKGLIPVYLIWLYWLNPMAWILRSLAVLQYRDERFDVCEYGGVDYCKDYGMQMGEYLLSTFDVPSDRVWLWYGVIFIAASYVFFLALAYWALENKRYESPQNFSLPSEPSAMIKNVPTIDGFSAIQTPQASSTAFRVGFDQENHVIPVTVAFRDLWYTVPDPKHPKQTIDLLKGVSGYALPGTITALMGSSGAGKTTLMDVIAGRKTGGKIQGSILLNGYPATDLAIRRATGYCEQMDVHSEASTFREALTFSAFLRQGKEVPESQKLDSVNECLYLLGLDSTADQIIRGSSKEQMKRLTIGVELAAQPSVLFLDEPTSGLDARSAKAIMDGVRKVACTGRTIVCTIHQPSAQVFRVFDSILLLKRGGETVFFGELDAAATELVSYFESMDGVERLREGCNPASWMLDVIGAGVDKSAMASIDFAKHFNCSALHHQLQAMLDHEGVGQPSSAVLPVLFNSKRAASEFTQMKFIMKRFFDLYWRTSSYNLTRFMVCMMIAVILGVVFVGAEYKSYQDVNSGVGMVYLTTIFVGVVAHDSVLPIAVEERAAFYRERAAQTYNAFWYFVGATIVEVPYVFLSSLLYTAIFFPFVGFTGFNRFLLYWLNTSVHSLLQTYIGQFWAYLLPDVDTAAAIGTLFATIFIVTMGFNPPASSLPEGYKWVYYITPQQYSLSSLSAVIFCDCPEGGDGSDLGCQAMLDAPPTLQDGITIKQYVEGFYWMKHDEIWSNFAIVLAMIAFMRVLALLALRFVNHQLK